MLPPMLSTIVIKLHCFFVSNAISFFFRKPTKEDSEWPSYSRDEPKYFIFDAEKTGLGKGPRTTYCAFWNEFLPKLKGIPGSYQVF